MEVKKQQIYIKSKYVLALIFAVQITDLGVLSKLASGTAAPKGGVPTTHSVNIFTHKLIKKEDVSMVVSRKTRVVVLSVSLTVLLLVSLFPVKAANQITLKVVIGPDTEDNRAQNLVTLEKIKRFEAANPGIVCRPVPFTYTTRQDFFIKQASRTAPDVLDVWATECELLAEQKLDYSS